MSLWLCVCMHFKLKRLNECKWQISTGFSRCQLQFIATFDDDRKSKRFKLVEHWPQCHSLNQLFTRSSQHFFFQFSESKSPTTNKTLTNTSSFQHTIKNRFVFFSWKLLASTWVFFVFDGCYCQHSHICIWLLALISRIIILQHTHIFRWNINYSKICCVEFAIIQQTEAHFENLINLSFLGKQTNLMLANRSAEIRKRMTEICENMFGHQNRTINIYMEIRFIFVHIYTVNYAYDYGDVHCSVHLFCTVHRTCRHRQLSACLR